MISYVWQSRRANTTIDIPYAVHLCSAPLEGALFTMPPHLHPRSRLTSSLFATTLLASFLVVGLPHLIPCPAPRVAYADGEIYTLPDGTQRRRRRRRCIEDGESEVLGNGTRRGYKGVIETRSGDVEEVSDIVDGNRGRECPIPKPRGKVGEILGFKQPERIARNAVTRPP